MPEKREAVKMFSKNKPRDMTRSPKITAVFYEPPKNNSGRMLEKIIKGQKPMQENNDDS